MHGCIELLEIDRLPQQNVTVEFLGVDSYSLKSFEKLNLTLPQLSWVLISVAQNEIQITKD